MHKLAKPLSSSLFKNSAPLQKGLLVIADKGQVNEPREFICISHLEMIHDLDETKTSALLLLGFAYPLTCP